MPQYEFLRGVLGMIGLACAYMTGRSLAMVRKGWHKLSRLYGWIIRSLVCLLAVIYRHDIDTVAVAVWAIALLTFGGGYWTASHTKPPEDLTHEIFPD
jgi:hypothetical protein